MEEITGIEPVFTDLQSLTQPLRQLAWNATIGPRTLRRNLNADRTAEGHGSTPETPPPDPSPSTTHDAERRRNAFAAKNPQILENPHQRQSLVLRTRLRPALVNEIRRARHARRPADPLDRTALTKLGPPYLPNLFHSHHPPPRSSESPKEQLNPYRKGRS